MKKAGILLVGGGTAGICVAKMLHQLGVDFVGLERSDSLGGHWRHGYARVSNSEAVRALEKWFGILEWERFSSPLQIRRKGEWETSENEKTEGARLLAIPAQKPNWGNGAENFYAEVAGKFSLNSAVISIHPAEKFVKVQGGEDYGYDTLVWCAPIQSLAKFTQPPALQLSKTIKKVPEAVPGLVISFQMKEGSALPESSCFTFRHKEYKLHALGSHSPSTQAGRAIWLIPLKHSELTEDTEETAKVVRSFKRELLKELPLLKDQMSSEHIVFENELPLHAPLETGEIEVLSDVFYVGPQLTREENTESLTAFDATALNCRRLETRFSEARPS